MDGEWWGLGVRGVNQLQGFADGGQHAQCQHINFQQTQGFQVFFVPLNDRAVRHAGVFYWHQLGQWSGRNDKTANVLRQMPWESQYGIKKEQKLLNLGAFRVEANGAQALI